MASRRKGRKPPSRRPNPPVHIRGVPDIGELFRSATDGEKIAFMRSLDVPRADGRRYVEIVMERAVHDQEVGLYAYMAYAWRMGHRRVRYMGETFVMKQDPTSEAFLATIGQRDVEP